MNTRNTVIYKLAKSVYLNWIHFLSDKRRKPLINRMKNSLLKFDNPSLTSVAMHLGESARGGGNTLNSNKLSIISSNCFAGRIMQDLGIKYNSPTLGLYFMYPDYIEFLRNLKYYLTEAKITFVGHSKYPIGDERRAAWSHWYPIGLLGGKVEIHFLHYHTEEEAASKWHRRARRVNFDRLLVIGMQQNLCSEKDIIDFDSLPFKNKIMFSCLPLPLRSNEYMPEFGNTDSVGDPYRKAHLFYRHLISHFS